MPPKRTSTSAAPAMTQATIRQLVADSVDAALEAQAATMARAILAISQTSKGEWEHCTSSPVTLSPLPAKFTPNTVPLSSPLCLHTPHLIPPIATLAISNHPIRSRKMTRNQWL
ncbi:hypothetical protein Tco_0168259 [Tanacetum coccineum]